MQRYTEKSKNTRTQKKKKSKELKQLWKSIENKPKSALMKKQWAKYLSKGTALTLMHYNKTSPLYKSYKNTTYCADLIVVEQGSQKVKSTYCKNRWCQVCNRIKTARLISGYMPEIDKLFQPVFITLTAPTVQGIDGLKKRIKEFEDTWRVLYKKTKRAKYKREYREFKGVRKMEVTIRPGGFYHYHFHLIVDGWAEGEWLIGQWLKKFPNADRKAQDIRFVDEFGRFEIFKYAIKSEVKQDKVSAERYDAVFQALRNKQTYRAFGGIKMIKEDFEDEDLINDLLDTGEPIVNIEIPDKVLRMISYPTEL